MIRLDDSRDELVNTPPNRITLSAGLQKLSWKSFQNLHANLEWTYVGQQQRVNPTADFAPPPTAYQLLSLEIQGETALGTHRLGAGININNMLNTRYRDYLDRFRYFADAQGINIHMKLYFII
jgi:iron complex outermembrane receptor protein